MGKGLRFDFKSRSRGFANRQALRHRQTMVKLGDNDFVRERFDDDDGLDDAGKGFATEARLSAAWLQADHARSWPRP
jgi:hypothetical protein